MEIESDYTSVNIDQVLNDDVVVTWSGGPDSTGLIRLLLENFSFKIHPIFINRCQTNYNFEKDSVNHYYNEFFSKNERFVKPVEVKIITPPNEFREFNDGTQYALRNSDILNQGIRLALHKKINTVLLATFEEENLQGDGSKKYLDAKTLEVRAGTDNHQFIVCSPFHFPTKFPKTKAELFHKCSELKFDLSKTWSCYGSGPLHCGTCPACTNRHAAFAETQTDPTQYTTSPNTVFEHRPEKMH